MTQPPDPDQGTSTDTEPARDDRDASDGRDARDGHDVRDARDDDAPAAVHTPDAAPTEQFPVPPPPARRSGPAQQTRRTPREDDAASVLDRPVDDVDLATRLQRPGLARSTRILLLVLGGVVCLVLGAFIGRATAPDTGPGSVPDLLGVVESVQPTGGGFPIVTVRSGDGTLTPLRTTAGTGVAVPRPDGPAGLRVGQQVTVHAERGADGAITAVRVDVPAGS
ncbi:hypothetical protein [Actinomycetospora callitridis]|uniref:hypothetical protein n=1 Tax=Actinomycetospora callitridis TaxID=913944 RepID=UPI00236600BD|nr:hypothetical protein [Actinomycetospora callitridis]MDD7919616.1 hypothetical protein [Actinomycetospora callitridis]